MTRIGRLPRSLRGSVVFLSALILVAIAAPLLAPYSPSDPLGIVLLKSKPPSLAHPFGTDLMSRDVLSRVLYGAQVSLAVAVASVFVALLVGTLFGAIAALAGGVVDGIMMRLLDLLLAIPRLLVLLAIIALWDRVELPALILLLGFTGWYDLARMIRSEVQALLGRDFVLAARASGVKRRRLLRRHLLPHLMPVLAVSATLGIANAITLEAGLGYLGLGVQPPIASWGSIMQDGMGVVRTQWWLTLFPGLATVLAVLACNALGDALRDAFTTEQVHG
ncbi:MAG: ABC transporter permease [Gemmatimonas sp.]